jgi:hypothetical protein
MLVGVFLIYFDEFSDANFDRYPDSCGVAFSRSKYDVYVLLDKVTWEISRIKAFMDSNAIEYDYMVRSGEIYTPVFHSGKRVQPHTN